MNRCGTWTTAACAAATLLLATAALAEAPAPPTAPIKGEAFSGAVEVTATVTKLDPKTREVTLKAADGREVTFVAGEEVRNFAQMKVGDVVTALYAEALAYEVTKGGKPLGVEAKVAGGRAEPGAKPAGAVGRQVTVTVTIVAIDPKVPSVTFKGPGGNTRTIKVMHPEKLQGVSVGDAVDLTYTEAIAIKVDSAKK